MSKAKKSRSRRRKNRKKPVSRKDMFSQYLEQRQQGKDLEHERKRQLARISALRQRPILVMAAYLTKEVAPILITYNDILSFQSILEQLEGEAIDVLLETPGGSAEVVEDLVNLLRNRFKKVAFIIPGWAKSAGTIMAMGGDEILMGPASALGPIDAQMIWNNKMFSADAFLKSLEMIKEEAEDPKKGLNRAYIPILQQISPGEIQAAQNALAFSTQLVSDWLRDYKFQNWTQHSDGTPVTDEEREETAKEIADALCEHQDWLTHGRSIKIPDLERMGLKITDYSKDSKLNEAIRSYHTLLHIAFESNLYKLFETQHSIIGKFWNVETQVPKLNISNIESLDIDIECPICNFEIPLQLKTAENIPDVPGRIPYPQNDMVRCPQCQQISNIAPVRQDIERKLKQEAISP